MTGYLASVLTILAINVITAFAVFLPASAGIINLGVAGFMAIGAYTAAWLDNNTDFSITAKMLAGGVVAALIAALVSFPILRLRGVYMVLATFGLAEIVQGVIINIDAVGAASGYAVTSYVGLPYIAGVAVLVFLGVGYLMATRIGLAMRAIHDDERAAEQMGVNVRATQVIAFSLGALLAGIAGALYGFQYNYIEIQNFNAQLSIAALLFVLLGGTQTVAGPLVGAGVYTLLPEALRGSTQWRFIVFAVVVIFMATLRPQGLVTRGLFRGRG